MSEWRLLLRLAEKVCDTSSPPARSAAAASAFSDIVAALTTSDNGEILFSPLGYCPEMTDMLVECACGVENGLGVRADAARCLLEVVGRGKVEVIQVRK